MPDPGADLGFGVFMVKGQPTRQSFTDLNLRLIILSINATLNLKNAASNKWEATMLPTNEIQKRLTELGYNPGPIDGIRGRQTTRAIKAFQTDSGLAPDGIVGSITRGKLFKGTPAPAFGNAPDLPWYEEARRLLGTMEVPGKYSNPVILDWAADLDIAYSGDDVPWCGLFVGHCIAATLPDEELPGGLLGARNWRKFGRHCEPTKGCVLVFWRTDPVKSFDGHVGFYAGEDTQNFYVLAGNQSNSVSVARVAKSRLLDSRFPSTAVFGEQKIVILKPGISPFSTDEA